MDTVTLCLMGLILLWNLIVFLVYAADKHRARRDKWRIPERTLLLCAFLLGGIGAEAGMRVLRHKTQHLRFRILVPMALALTIAALGSLGYLQWIRGW